jgi:hypothetical protein
MPTSTYMTTREAAALADRLAKHVARIPSPQRHNAGDAGPDGIPAHPCAAAPCERVGRVRAAAGGAMMQPASVTPLRPKDPTGAARQRRYRQRRREAVTAIGNGGIDTVAVCALAGRLSAGQATRTDMEAAGRLIAELVCLLPATA